MKRKSLLTLTVLFATAAFTALSLSACAKSEENKTLPEGWEVTSADGNIEYLTLKEGEKGPLIRHSREWFAAEFIENGECVSLSDADYIELHDASSLYVYGMDEEGYGSISTGEDLVLVYYYGGFPTERSVRADIQAEVRIQDDRGFLDAELLAACRVKNDDFFDVGRDENQSLYAKHALRISIPGTAFPENEDGKIDVYLQFPVEEGFHGHENVVEQEEKIRFYRRDGQVYYSLDSLDVVESVRSRFPFSVYEAYDFILGGLLVLEIGLFVWALIAKRTAWYHFASLASVGILAAVFSRVAMRHFEKLPTDISDMWGAFEYEEQIGVTFLLGFVFLLLTAILALILVFVRKRKRKKAAHKEEP